MLILHIFPGMQVLRIKWNIGGLTTSHKQDIELSMKKTMLLCLVVLQLFSSSLATAKDAAPKPKLLFSITNLSNPESVVFYGDTLFISNIGAKNPAKGDGDGWIQKVNMATKASEKWFTGLNDPKGLKIFKDKLYISDLNRVVVVDIASGKIEKMIPVKGSQYLNDVELDNNGNIYISDTQQSAIYYIDAKTNKSAVLIKDLEEAPNGLYYKDNRLYVASWAYRLDPKDWSFQEPGSFFYINLSDKVVNHIQPRKIGALDGLEEFTPNRWFISSKNDGKLYLIDSEKGTKTLLIDDAVDVADIGYDKVKSLLSLPLMRLNEVRIYMVKAK